MSDKCPLGTGLYWNHGGNIPNICVEQCESIWQDAARGPEIIDVFNEDCMKSCPIEFEDDAIQRTNDDSQTRLYSILNHCFNHSVEMYASEYTFDCPFN